MSFLNSDQVEPSGLFVLAGEGASSCRCIVGQAHAPVVFDQPGIVTLGCNIHDNMAAFIVVTAAPFFGRTDNKGGWTIPNLPEGAVSHPDLARAAEGSDPDARSPCANRRGEQRCVA